MDSRLRTEPLKFWPPKQACGHNANLAKEMVWNSWIDVFLYCSQYTLLALWVHPHNHDISLHNAFNCMAPEYPTFFIFLFFVFFRLLSLFLLFFFFLLWRISCGIRRSCIQDLEAILPTDGHAACIDCYCVSNVSIHYALLLCCAIVVVIL